MRALGGARVCGDRVENRARLHLVARVRGKIARKLLALAVDDAACGSMDRRSTRFINAEQDG
jgi:hypothetical protein